MRAERAGERGDRRTGAPARRPAPRARDGPESREDRALRGERELGDERERADDTPPDECGPRVRRARPVTAVQAARLAARYVAEMTGEEPEQVTSLERVDGGGWRVGVEVLEIARIPDTTDVLAVYEAELDGTGELVSYRRTDRYLRGQVRGGG